MLVGSSGSVLSKGATFVEATIRLHNDNKIKIIFNYTMEFLFSQVLVCFSTM